MPTNSWLVASATIPRPEFASRSRPAHGKTAEKRLRDTCTQVLAGMGDTIKDRLPEFRRHFNDDEGGTSRKD